MCLIICNQTSNSIPEKFINLAYFHNHDGFGIMWAERGKINTIQGLFDLKEIKKIISSVKHKHYAAHFRYTTAGSTTADMTHPFPINYDLYMMHNGVLLPDVNPTETESDTFLFAKKLSRKPEMINSNLGKYIGFQNKLVFLHNNGKFTIINEEVGHYINGMWFSNRYSIQNTKEEADKMEKNEDDYAVMLNSKFSI